MREKILTKNYILPCCLDLNYQMNLKLSRQPRTKLKTLILETQKSRGPLSRTLHHAVQTVFEIPQRDMDTKSMFLTKKGEVW